MASLLFSVFPLFAQQQSAAAQPHRVVELSALQAVDLARKGNRTLIALEHQLSAASWEVRSAVTGLLPHASLTGNYSRKSGNDMYSTFAGKELNNSYSVGLEIQQPVFTGFATIGSLKSARLSRTLQETTNDKTEQVIRYAVLQVYRGIVTLQKSMTVARQAVLQLDELTSNQAAMVEQGMATEHDYLLTKASFAQAKMNELNAGKTLLAMKRQFAVLLGLPVTTDLVLTDTTARMTSQLPENTDSIVAAALSGRPDLKEAALKLQLSDIAVTMTRSAWYPTLVAGFSWTANRPDFAKLMQYQEERWGDDWYGYVALNFDLVDWGDRFFKVKKAKEQRLSLLSLNKEKKATVEKEVRDACQIVDQERRALETATLLSGAREAAYHASQAKYEEGVLPMYELLDAHGNFVSAKYQVLQAAMNLELAIINLEMGGLGTGGE
jgi:outer membrane protein